MGVDDLVGAVVSGATDLDGVRAAAGTVRAVGEATAEAAARTRTVSGVDWRSVAADRFRDELAASCGQLDACRRQLEELAVSLARHATGAEGRAEDLAVSLALSALAAEKRAEELAVSLALGALAAQERLRLIGEVLRQAPVIALDAVRRTTLIGHWNAP